MTRLLPVNEADAILSATARIVSAYLQRNATERGQLESLIREVFAALRSCFAPELAPAEPPKPAVPINRSVRTDHLVCLECGTRVKMLRRHLLTRHQLSPPAYRAKWGLPREYPLVAPDYAARRSALAKELGLGRREPPPPPPAPEPAPSRGRRRKGT